MAPARTHIPQPADALGRPWGGPHVFDATVVRRPGARWPPGSAELARDGVSAGPRSPERGDRDRTHLACGARTRRPGDVGMHGTTVSGRLGFEFSRLHRCAARGVRGRPRRFLLLGSTSTASSCGDRPGIVGVAAIRAGLRVEVCIDPAHFGFGVLPDLRGGQPCISGRSVLPASEAGRRRAVPSTAVTLSPTP